MNSKQKLKQTQRARRHGRIRARITGTASRPRLSVYRSLVHIYAQLIDDTTGKTLASSSDKELNKNSKGDKQKKTARAQAVGKALADKAKAAGIEQVVFDRGGYKYHGRVKALADGAREGGLKF